MARIAMGLVGVTGGWLVPGAVAAQERAYEWWWGIHPMGWMWGTWGIAMMLIMLAFWGAVIVGLELRFRWLVSQGKESRSHSAPEILRQRYARGEINKDEFEVKKRDFS